MIIIDVKARRILDSRGYPTVEVDITLENGSTGRAAVPSGASTGVHEAHELRDGGAEYGGKDVAQAINNVNSEIRAAITGMQADDQFLLDQTLIDLDGTPNKQRLGANAILAVSLAVAKAAADCRNLPLYKHINDIAQNPTMSLPMPMMNVLNGGKHANNSADFQEFMIIPHSADSIETAIRMGSEVYYALKKKIAADSQSTAVGDEGGFTYPVESNKQMFDLLMTATKDAGYTPGEDILFASDVAASEFYDDPFYKLDCENRVVSPEQMTAALKQLTDDYPLVSIEDGLDQDQWQDWTEQTEKLHPTQIVGDDLLVTNYKRLEKAITEKAANAILIKLNQIGTLTETIRTISLAQENDWGVVVSHRSGETEDTTIAHLAVGTGAGQIKTGSLSRGERIAKYNELIRIAENDASLELAKPFKR